MTRLPIAASQGQLGLHFLASSRKNITRELVKTILEYVFSCFAATEFTRAEHILLLLNCPHIQTQTVFIVCLWIC